MKCMLLEFMIWPSRGLKYTDISWIFRGISQGNNLLNCKGTKGVGFTSYVACKYKKDLLGKEVKR